MEAIVRVINGRTNRIVLEFNKDSEVDAYRLAREIAAEYAEHFGDEEWFAEKDLPFVPDPLNAYDCYSVIVFVRDESGYLGWRGQREVEYGLVQASGYCASC